YDRPRLALADVDLRQLQAIGVRVLCRVDDPADDEAVDVAVLVWDARAHDPLDLRRRNREPGRELVERHLERHVLREPRERYAHQNCLSTRRSPSHSARMSGMSCRSCAARSSPQPNANPPHSSGSRPTFRNTCGSTTPAPPISIQPENLHVRQPAPPQTPHDTSGSIDGSVNRK